MKKEFDYNLAELGDFFTTSWTSKKLEFKKTHAKVIDEELRLENLTDNKLEIEIVEHAILKHPKTVLLKPKEVKNIIIKIPCAEITGKHESYLILESKNQKEKIPVKINHVK